MTNSNDLRSSFSEKASGLVRKLSPSERETLLTKCWMSHDARWFMAVAQEFGIESASRLNQTAARGVGNAEARRLARAIDFPPATTVDDWLLFQEAAIALLGPFLVDYSLRRDGDDAYWMDVERCFAHDNAMRAGIIDDYDCGIFARVEGWLDALDLRYEMTPPLTGCLMAQGKPCSHRIAINGTGTAQHE
jgi:hypothetical protein